MNFTVAMAGRRGEKKAPIQQMVCPYTMPRTLSGMANSCCPQHCTSFQEEQFVTRSLETKGTISHSHHQRPPKPQDHVHKTRAISSQIWKPVSHKSRRCKRQWILEVSDLQLTSQINLEKARFSHLEHGVGLWHNLVHGVEVTINSMGSTCALACLSAHKVKWIHTENGLWRPYHLACWSPRASYRHPRARGLRQTHAIVHYSIAMYSEKYSGQPTCPQFGPGLTNYKPWIQ